MVLVVDDVELVVGGSLVVGTSLELVELLVGTTVDVDVLVTASHVQTTEHTSPGSHVNAPVGELGSHGSPGSTTPFPHRPGVVVEDVDVVVDDDVVEDVDDVVLVVGPLVEVVDDVSQVHAAEHTSPGAHVNAPVGELGSHGSPGSTTPFPHSPGCEVVVVVDVVVVVETASHVHVAEHTSPGAHVNAPVGELGSHGSLGSTTPFPHRPGPVVLVVEELVVDELLVDELVVETGSQVHTDEQTSPGAHVNAPVGELGSHGSLGSTTPFPHNPGPVVVVVDDVVTVVVEVAPLHSGGYGTNSGTARRSRQSTLNSVTQSTH